MVFFTFVFPKLRCRKTRGCNTPPLAQPSPVKLAGGFESQSHLKGQKSQVMVSVTGVYGQLWERFQLWPRQGAGRLTSAFSALQESEGENHLATCV